MSMKSNMVMTVFYIVNIAQDKISQLEEKYHMYLRNRLEKFIVRIIKKIMNKIDKYSILIKGNRPKETIDGKSKVSLDSVTISNVPKY